MSSVFLLMMIWAVPWGVFGRLFPHRRLADGREGLSLCHWHSCHLTQVIWRIRCRNGKSSQHGRVFEQIHCHSLWCMRLGLIRHFYLCLENCTVYLMFWISMKSFGSMVSAECHMNHMNKFHVLICHNVFSTDQLKPSLDSFNTVTSDMADMVQYPKNWNTHKICRFDSYIVQIYIYIDLTNICLSLPEGLCLGRWRPW